MPSQPHRQPRGGSRGPHQTDRPAPREPRLDLVALAADVRAKVTPALADAGFDVEAVTLRRAGSRTVVDVTVDRDGPLDLDAVADASRVVEDLLDAADTVPGAYVLEVGTRGVDTPLTLPRHWRRAVGRLVTCTLDGRSLTARVTSVADGDEPGVLVALERADGTTVEAPADTLGRAVTQVEFNRPDEPDLEDEPDLDEDDLDELDDTDDDTDETDEEDDA